MRAIILNCTLKPSSQTSNTEALAGVVIQALSEQGVETEVVRVVDHDVKPGVTSDEGGGEQAPDGRPVAYDRDEGKEWSHSTGGGGRRQPGGGGPGAAGGTMPAPG